MHSNRISMAVLLIAALTACNGDNTDDFVASAIVEGTAIKVSAQTGGLILSMSLAEGEDVQIGQTVAVIDTEKLAFQLEQIEAGLQEISVQRKIAQNTLSAAHTNFENVKKKYQRFQDLYKQNSASKQTLDGLETAYDNARSQLENAEQNLQIIESKEKGVNAQRKLLRRQIDDAVVNAPISGTLTTRFYEPGETVAPGLPVVEIIDLSRMWTKVYVSELMLPHVQVDGAATVKVDGSDQSLSGRIGWISSKAEFTPKNILTEESRTSLVYAVKVEIDNPNGILKHGMPVEVVLH